MRWARELYLENDVLCPSPINGKTIWFLYICRKWVYLNLHTSLNMMKLNKFVSICMYVFVVENRYLNCRTYCKNHVLHDKTIFRKNFFPNVMKKCWFQKQVRSGDARSFTKSCSSSTFDWCRYFFRAMLIFLTL